MRFSIPSRVRMGWASAGLALLAVACDRSDQMVGPQAAPSPTLALQVSSRGAASGERVAVAISNPSRTISVGGVQGTLTFDATRLRFRGQVRDGSDDVLMVNAARANAGELRFAVLDVDGLSRSGSLVFDVIRDGDYASSIGFSVEETMLNGSPVRRVSASVARDLEINSALSTDVNAKPITPNEWAELTKSKGGASLSRDPGEIRNPLRYGDTNFDGAITTGDAVYLINVSLGLNEMIVGTDGTGGTGDRDAVVAGNVFPFGPPVGVEANGDRVLSIGDAVAVLNESISINQPAVGDIIPGRPATPVTNRVIVNANVTTNTTWTSDNIYELHGGIFVTNNATLTIQPGTRVEGARGTGPGVEGSALFISRDGKIVADGTPLQPIVFTCVGDAPALPKAKGCWGGISVNGNAGINDGTLTSPVIPGRADVGGCREKQAEGGAGLYGGCNDDDNSGILRYVRVEYAGFRFTPENEANGIQFTGVGRGTIIDFVQVHAGLDDGIEMFGGTANLKHLVLTANEDDSFDYTEGYRGKVQFVIIQHDPLDSDKGTEQDNFEFNHDATPRAEPVFFNWTLIGKPVPSSPDGVPNNNSIAAYNIRRGARPHFFNQYVQNWRAVMDIDDESTCVGSQTAAGFEYKNSIIAGTNVSVADPDAGDPLGCANGDEAAFITGQPTNQVLANSTLISPLNFMVPDWRPAFGTATGGATPPSDGFFDPTATYVGAVPPANAGKSNIPWYSGWTRGWQSPTTP